MSSTIPFACRAIAYMMAIQHTFWRRNLRLAAFKMLIFSLILVMTNISALTLTVMRIQNALEQQAAQFLGGDLKISSPTPFPPQFQKTALDLGLSTANTIEFITMLKHDDNTVLSEIKAVDHHYPLIGDMQVFTSDLNQPTALRHGPRPGKIWLEPRLLRLLNASLSDSLILGNKRFEIEYLIQVEPDKINSGFFSPRAMIAEADLANTGLIQAGSRAQYYLLLSGSPDKCAAFEKTIQAELQPNQTLTNAIKNKNIAQQTLENSSIYVYFSGFINLLLAGIALYFSVKQYLKTQVPWVAFLKCAGIMPQTLIRWYLSGFLLYGSGSLLLGMCCGFLLSEWGLSSLSHYLPQMATGHIPWVNAGIGFICVNGLFLGFIFPFIRHLSQTPAIQVINRQTSNPQFDFTYYAIGLGFLCLAPFLFRGQRDTIMAMTMGFIGITAICLSFMHGVLIILSRVSSHFGSLYRYLCAELVHHRSESAIQLLIFTLLLSIMMTLYSVKTQLLSQWFEDLPAKTPNYFLINISEELKTPLVKYSQENNVNLNRLYGIVRGRLFKINDKPLLNDAHYSEKKRLNRLWNLTFTNELPLKNMIVSGKWFRTPMATTPVSSTSPLQTEVSLEQDVAESIGLKLGDILSFQIDEKIIEARLTSIRSVSWQTFQPNFFAIFPKELGEHFTQSYMTSVYIPFNQTSTLKKLSHDFQSIYVIDINMLLEQIKTLYKQVSILINSLFLYSFVFSLLIFFSITRANASEKIRNNHILHIIGIKARTISSLNFGEYCIIGLISGLSALVVSSIASKGLLQHIFHVHYQFNPLIVVLSLLFSPLLGFFGKKFIQGFNKKIV
jgi:putative ABC transport system permease protein